MTGIKKQHRSVVDASPEVIAEAVRQRYCTIVDLILTLNALPDDTKPGLNHLLGHLTGHLISTKKRVYAKQRASWGWAKTLRLLKAQHARPVSNITEKWILPFWLVVMMSKKCAIPLEEFGKIYNEDLNLVEDYEAPERVRKAAHRTVFKLMAALRNAPKDEEAEETLYQLLMSVENALDDPNLKYGRHVSNRGAAMQQISNLSKD